MKTAEENRVLGLQKELRLRLYEMGLQIQLMNERNQEQVRETIDGICELIGFAKLTKKEEEKNLFPSLAISAPFMVSLLEQDQDRILELGEKISIVVEQWENSVTVKQQQHSIQQIQLGFNDWMASLLQYLNKQQLLQTGVEEQRAKKPLAVAAA
jgi:hypothetical protein